MRPSVTSEKLTKFMVELGRRAKSPGRVYLVGGSTAVLLGARSQTVDVDLKLEPEPAGVFEAIAHLKESLDINVELASPDDFLPALPGWRERSEFVARYGPVEFFHYDFYSQCLAKVLRSNETDRYDARWYVDRGYVSLQKLQQLFEAVKPELIRFPGVDVEGFDGAVTAFCQGDA